MVAWRWRFLFSSSELCEEDDGSTSETPESAGLGGSEPAKFGANSMLPSATQTQKEK